MTNYDELVQRLHITRSYLANHPVHGSWIEASVVERAAKVIVALRADLAAARAIAAEYRSALRVVFFPDHNEREWQSLAECQEWARLECVRIDAALAKEKA